MLVNYFIIGWAAFWGLLASSPWWYFWPVNHGWFIGLLFLVCSIGYGSLFLSPKNRPW